MLGVRIQPAPEPSARRAVSGNIGSSAGRLTPQAFDDQTVGWDPSVQMANRASCQKPQGAFGHIDLACAMVVSRFGERFQYREQTA